MQYPISDSHEDFNFDWELVLQPSTQKPRERVKCPDCHGHGMIGGGFGSMDGQEDCWKCNCTGYVLDPYYHWNPKPPQALVNKLLKVWREYWNEQQNEQFELTSPAIEE